MSERNNDDIANALHGLSSGEHVEPEAPGGSGTGQAHHFDHATPSPAPPPPPAPNPPPQAVRPPAARPPAAPFRASPKPVPPSPTSPTSPPGPAAPRPNAPPTRPRAHPQPQPSPSSRPAIPSAPRGAAPDAPPRPESPVQPGRVSRNVLPPGARPVGSATPNLTPPENSAAGFASDQAEVETTNVQPVDEDDRVIVPAAPLSSLGPRPHHGQGAARVPVFKTLKFRRTAIPVLLTSGVLLLGVAASKYLVDGDAVLATMSTGMFLGLAGAGVLLLCVAALNMVQVRQQLAADRAGATPRP